MRQRWKLYYRRPHSFLLHRAGMALGLSPAAASAAGYSFQGANWCEVFIELNPCFMNIQGYLPAKLPQRNGKK